MFKKSDSGIIYIGAPHIFLESWMPVFFLFVSIILLDRINSFTSFALNLDQYSKKKKKATH